MLINDTIIAPLTGSAGAAVSLIRISGPEAWNIGRQLSPGISPFTERTCRLVKLKDGDEVLDEALFTAFKAPASYTGEDVLEISIHGSPYIHQRLIELALLHGARLAEAGEFTRRAFLNRKMDLSQAEAVADVIAAENAMAHKISMHQMRGGFRDELTALRDRLIEFASLIELELDFSEEDVEFANRHQLLSLLNEIHRKCCDLAGSFRQGHAIRTGIPVAIAGKPNAGKSTLLNALLKEERAIVSDIPGTTRDTIEERFTLNGVTFRLMDTAGLRETADVVERIGVERATEKIATSAVVLYVFDTSLTNKNGVKAELDAIRKDIHQDALLIPVANKTDLASEKKIPNAIHISAQHGQGMDTLLDRLAEIATTLSATEGQTVVSNIRHAQALKETAEAVERVREGLNNGLSGDLVAADIRGALHHLGSITGEITTDDLLGSIFGRFCIGK
ncbi:MAG: tRNA uridine-5-carboxymethylaminomethyl(34) synthesis GTPase MnmE [Flavobacteriales bacterium]|nr:tRNA uridine-5-carboxymethylaminomethyl(34) synthesis GTPase MnmE [Flavobacteriales bacterium]